LGGALIPFEKSELTLRVILWSSEKKTEPRSGGNKRGRGTRMTKGTEWSKKRRAIQRVGKG